METTLHYLTFDEVGITFAAIAVALAFIVLVWNASKAIKEWIASLKKPENDRIDSTEEQLKDHEQRISNLEGCCVEVQTKLKNDWEFQRDETEMNRLMLKSIKQLLKHSIDGNDREGLKHMEDEIDGYLLDHTQ